MNLTDRYQVGMTMKRTIRRLRTEIGLIAIWFESIAIFFTCSARCVVGGIGVAVMVVESVEKEATREELGGKNDAALEFVVVVN